MQEEKEQNHMERVDQIVKTKKSNTFWKVDKRMLPYKLHFFLYIGAMGALCPFRPAIGITRLGLGAGNLAVVYTVQQFLFIVFKPLIGYITDYFNSLKTMIVILTVINGVLSYLLLVIPRIDHISVSGLNESLSMLRSAEANFCRLCHNSDQIQKAAELLPKRNNISENGISCGQRNIVPDVFVGHCEEIDPISATSSNMTYKITFETCSVSYSETLQKSGTNTESQSLNISDYMVYITVIKNRVLPQFIVACPKMKNVTSVGNLKFTLAFIMRSCYITSQQNLPVISTNSGLILNDTVCRDPALDKDGMNLEATKSNSFKTYQFWLYALFLILSCACTSAIFTLSDTACYESLQETGAEYGKQRAWGAVSWGLVAPFAGFLNDYTDSYLAAMILMTVLCALQIWNLYKIDLIKPQNSKNILKDVKTILGSAEFLAFSVGVLFNGMGIGIVWFFLAWFITDIGGSRLLIGLAHTMQCFLGEVPFMILSGWLIKKFGHFNVVSMALLAHCVRFLAYSSLRNPWLILPIECLDGITFGAFYSAMTSYGKLNSKPGTEATTQSLLCSTYEGLGAGLGCVIAGVCFDYYGGYKTFFYAGICFGAAAVINIASSVVLRFRKGSLKVPKDKNCDKGRY